MEITVAMPYGDSVVDRDGSNEAIDGREDSDAAPSASPVDFGRRQKYVQGDGIAEHGKRQERPAECVALRTGPEPLQNLLNDGAAGSEADKIFLPQGTARLRVQELDPDGGVHEDH